MKQSAAELMDLAKEKSGERRRELMHRVADMYFQFGPRIDDPELALFDDVLSQLAQEMESRVRAELANRMALARTPPVRLIRTLARDEIIDVASPILQLSRAVSEEDLIDLARTRGDAHLKAGLVGPSETIPVIAAIESASSEAASNTGGLSSCMSLE